MMLIPDCFYHIYTHANGFEDLFKKEENYRYFLEKWAKYMEPVVDTYAYCLMPNHFHFLIRIKPEKEILKFVAEKKNLTLQGFQTLGGLDASKAVSQQLSHLLNGYTQAYNRMYGRRGSLFIPNFNRKQIEDDDYLTDLIVYIHRNPVHHSFTAKMSDWKWSSYRAIIRDQPTKVSRDEVLNWFGGLQSFLAAHQHPPELIT